MDCPFIPPNEKPDVKYHSSVNQHRNKLSVMKGGMWCPIAFDSLDYIDCDKIASHLACVTDGDDIGYEFPIKKCIYTSDIYTYADHKGVEYEALNSWFGEGIYEVYVNKKAFVNADNGALGSHNRIKANVGLNYALADYMAEPVE